MLHDREFILACVIGVVGFAFVVMLSQHSTKCAAFKVGIMSDMEEQGYTDAEIKKQSQRRLEETIPACKEQEASHE